MNGLDQVARDIAHSALAAIQEHERVCEERANTAADQRGNMVSSMQRIESASRVYMTTATQQIEGLYSRFWWVAMSFIGAMFTIIILLVTILLSGKGHA